MADGANERAGRNGWSELLAQTRQALATLCAEDLEELAARADCMLSAAVGHDGIRQRIPRPQEQELVDLTRQNRLLGDLLHATDRNLAVLRQLRGDEYGRTHTRKVNSRWAR
jgi:hypothetical protein